MKAIWQTTMIASYKGSPRLNMNFHLCTLKGFTLKYADDVDGIQLYRKWMAEGSGNEMGVPSMTLFSLGRCKIALPHSNNKGDE